MICFECRYNSVFVLIIYYKGGAVPYWFIRVNLSNWGWTSDEIYKKKY